jgi:hypothetical protein
MRSEQFDSSRDETDFISAVMGFDLLEIIPLNANTVFYNIVFYLAMLLNDTSKEIYRVNPL